MSSLTFASLIRPILLFFAAFIVLLPLRWQWRTSKVPAFSLIAWLFVSNFINAVGSVIWMKDTGPGLNGRLNGAVSVYCDIATKIIVGSWTAVPVALACIANRLKVASARRRTPNTASNPRRENFVDVVACFGVPAVFMALHYIIQDHRFDLIEVIGCQPAVFHSVPSVFIVWIPVLLLSLITFIFACFAIHSFISTRPVRTRSISPPHNFRHISHPYPLQLPTTATNLPRPSRVPQPTAPEPPYHPCLFIRLLTLVSLAATVLMALTITDIVHVLTNGKMRPYPGFETVHKEISRVDVYFLSRRVVTDGEVRAPIHFIQLLTWTAPAPTAAYIFILTVSHWCECMRFVAKIGGLSRWLGWKIARLRGWMSGEKVWEEESAHEIPVTHYCSASSSLTTSVSRASMSTLPPYSLETNYTANPFPARPNTKRVPPPLLLTNSNRPIPHALRPSSLYGAPAQVHSSSVEEMGQIQRHKSRSNVAQAQAPMTAQTPVTTLVYESPTFEARTHAQQASRGSSSSWASFPLASPVTQQELMLPELPDVVKQYAIDRAKVRKSTGGSVDKGTLTKEERLSRRSAVYGGTFGSMNTFGSGHMRSTSASASIGGTSVTRNETNEDDAPVRISVGSRPVSLRRVPVPTAQPVQQPIPVPVPQTPRVRVQSYEVISFPIPQVYDDNVGTNSNTVIPATNKPLPRSVSGASTSTRHHKPQNTSSDGSDSSAEVPKYHMPSRLARDGSLNHGRGGSTDSGAESGSEYSGPGIAGVGSGKWV